MAFDFVCPSCKESLLKNGKITLKGVLKGKHFSVSSIFELNEQKENFGGKALSDNINFEKGAKVDFYCPHCGKDLTTIHDEDFAEILHISENKEEESFVFSKIAGKEMSFLVHKGKQEISDSFGKDKDDYKDKIYEYYFIERY